MEQAINNFLTQWLFNKTIVILITKSVLLTAVLLISFLARFLFLKILGKLLKNFASITRNRFDNFIFDIKIMKRMSLFIPLLITYLSIEVIFPGYLQLVIISKRILLSIIIIVGIYSFNGILDAVDSWYRLFEVSNKTPIKGYMQLFKIFMATIGIVFIIATILAMSPWGILSSIGAMTAILLLIFRDSILGFVASIQIHTNNLVNIGDWIEVPKYNADGDVIDISLTTIKVRNWDKTISTIPTYSLISDTFKNWQGMTDSGGRRIKRKLYIDMNSIKFCDQEMIDRYKKIHLIEDYLKSKEKDIEKHNNSIEADANELINGRCLTNIGTFRAYILAYLKNHHNLRQDMTLLVRHRDLTEHGLPIEIYCFTNTTKWADYEGIQADIFDHILGAVPFFNLRLFQSPAGHDLMNLVQR